MQMVVSRAGIPTIADVGDCFTLFGEMTFGQAFRISIEVCVVVDELTISAHLINRGATAFARKEFHDGSVRRGNYGGAPRSRDINRIMNASFRARLREGISQLFGPHSDHWNDQIRGRP